MNRNSTGIVIARFLEVLGIFLLSRIFWEITKPYLIGRFGMTGNILSWCLFGIFCITAGFAIRKLKGGWKPGDVGIKLHRGFLKDIWYGLVVFAMLYFVMIPFIIALMPLFTDMFLNNLGSYIEQPMLPGLLKMSALIFTIGFFTGAFHEEIRYRGYMQGVLTKDIAPAFGFFISMIVFSLHHYYSHPEWSLLQVANTIPAGIAFCLSYYATGSILVPLTMHALGNFIPVLPPYFAAKGFTILPYGVIAGIAVLFMVVIYLGRNEAKHFLIKSKELFAISGLKNSLAAAFLGFVFLIGYHEIMNIGERFSLENTTYYILLTVISAACIGLSFLRKENVNKRY
ncbi:lysostaphin resistance A-like protein [Candidatus Latescibacterota bacterium]